MPPDQGDVDRESVEFVGPFDRWDVVVGGRQVPYLEGRPVEGGRILFSLDHRFALDRSYWAYDVENPPLSGGFLVS